MLAQFELKFVVKTFHQAKNNIFLLNRSTLKLIENNLSFKNLTKIYKFIYKQLVILQEIRTISN